MFYIFYCERSVLKISFGTQINEVINNICEKLGVTANYIIPKVAEYKSVMSMFGIIVSRILVVIFVALAILMNKKSRSE